MDNGSPWGTQSALPSALGLWMVGLGIELVYGRPARSTDNAVVERSHGVLNQWSEPTGCVDFDDCQQQVDWAVHTQRERYRQPGKPTRWQAYPDLQTNPRGYHSETEAQVWELARVCGYVSGFRFQRKVEQNGRITLFANPYSVGSAYQRQTVEIQLDPTTCEWVIHDQRGGELRRHLAKELDYDQIRLLQLAKRRRT